MCTFKIDLIVWKSLNKSAQVMLYDWFKIDLIVWKCTDGDDNNDGSKKFKIDLIVWKFRYLCI